MLKRLLVGVSFLMLGAFGLQAQSSSTQSGSQSGNQSDTQQSDMQRSNSQLSRTDQDFVNKAYQSNLNEIQIGQLAAQKSTNDEVKQYAQKLVDDHTRANEQLQQIASTKGITLPSSTQSSEQNRFANLSGSEFDRQFMQSQKQAHREAIQLYRRQADSGTDPELKSFASSQLSALQQHESMANNLSSRVGSEPTGNQMARSDTPSDTSTSRSSSSTSTTDTFDSTQSSRSSESQQLPRTASNMPLIGLFGFLLIGAALIMRSFRLLRSNR